MISETQTFEGLQLPPRRDTAHIRQLVRSDLKTRHAKIAVVDDDPTGTQTVRDVPLVTDWTEDELSWAAKAANPLFTVLTNSRAVPEAEAVAINSEIGERLGNIARRLDIELRVVSRSDSTLRGHFPAEPEALAVGLDQTAARVDAVVVCPAFPEAGRVTVNGIHWVNHAGRVIPVAETDYARDGAFGFKSSDLKDWVRERAGARVSVAAITIDDIRVGGPSAVAERLLSRRDKTRYVVADSASSSDLDVLAWGIAIAEAQGMRLLYRTGPSFLTARAGVSVAEPLSSAEIAVPGGRGLLAVGSYTELTTEQLNVARQEHDFELIELDVEQLLTSSASQRAAMVSTLAEQVSEGLLYRDVAIATSRKVASAALDDRNLQTIGDVGGALVEIVRSVANRADLDWLVAKGGITSSDLAVKALRARRVTVLGQVFRGQVSVWRLGDESLVPGLRYCVFPGNVGDHRALSETLNRLKGIA